MEACKMTEPAAARPDLDGLVVVSVEQAVAAPLLSSRLAEAGDRMGGARLEVLR